MGGGIIDLKLLFFTFTKANFVEPYSAVSWQIFEISAKRFEYLTAEGALLGKGRGNDEKPSHLERDGNKFKKNI